MTPNNDLLALRQKHNIRPLQDLILDAIRRAVKKTGSVYGAAPLLGVAPITLHKRMRDGYSDGRKPVATDIIDKRNKRVCNYDWSQVNQKPKP